MSEILFDQLSTFTFNAFYKQLRSSPAGALLDYSCSFVETLPNERAHERVDFGHVSRPRKFELFSTEKLSKTQGFRLPVPQILGSGGKLPLPFRAPPKLETQKKNMKRRSVGVEWRSPSQKRLKWEDGGNGKQNLARNMSFSISQQTFEVLCEWVKTRKTSLYFPLRMLRAHQTSVSSHEALGILDRKSL